MGIKVVWNFDEDLKQYGEKVEFSFQFLIISLWKFRARTMRERERALGYEVKNQIIESLNFDLISNSSHECICMS